ncbi:MAG: cysteine--tRNA ligase [Candidatus Sumerlaeota bacterium]|nr:cysteine--tRNA ligase [Candidatus Sumerlaeota bacterium]
MKLSIHNTMTRRIEPLETILPGKVGVYCCGPTVYNFAHIGNMRTYIFEDILRRALEMAGLDVKHVMNITDVGHLTSDADEGEDKMIVAMRREGKTAHDIADFYAQSFFRHADMLNIKRPTIICKATEHIAEMIALTQRLEERGMAYVAGGNVYFDVSKFPAYGKLAGLDLGKLRSGARIEVDANKRNPQDFALWFTKSKFENQEMIWDSPWGRGYPGWHIECSAMSMKYLGEQFDIHCGGIDHVPVHHTNEIAQSEGATGKSPWVRVWMHGEWLILEKKPGGSAGGAGVVDGVDQVDGVDGVENVEGGGAQLKMSKSSGNFITVDTLVAHGYDPLAYRYLCLGAHYRQQLGFSYEALDGAANGLNSLRRAVLAIKKEAKGIDDLRLTNDDSKRPSPESRTPSHESARLREFQNFLADDLNVPRALSVVWASLKDEMPPSKKMALVYRFDDVLGLGFKELEERKEEIPAEVMRLVEERAAVRKAKDWAASDRIRDQIAALGYNVKDTPQGAEIAKK